MKPYQQIPILECGEPLVPIPLNVFAVQQPHPYQTLNAPYGAASPYFLRQGVLDQLLVAQDLLQNSHPKWRIQVFDAYRPVAVQKFMVDYTFKQAALAQGKTPEQLTDAERTMILKDVYQFWAVPSSNPQTPPPHSTGAAVDITLVDAVGCVIDMGSPIDELSARSYPNYYEMYTTANTAYHAQLGELTPERSQQYATFHANRQLLQHVMIAAKFRQHPNEWWHFSLGDQLWAWLMNQESSDTLQIARYGAI